jgi:hypothetical protein
MSEIYPEAIKDPISSHPAPIDEGVSIIIHAGQHHVITHQYPTVLESVVDVAKKITPSFEDAVHGISPHPHIKIYDRGEFDKEHPNWQQKSDEFGAYLSKREDLPNGSEILEYERETKENLVEAEQSMENAKDLEDQGAIDDARRVIDYYSEQLNGIINHNDVVEPENVKFVTLGQYERAYALIEGNDKVSYGSHVKAVEENMRYRIDEVDAVVKEYTRFAGLNNVKLSLKAEDLDQQAGLIKGQLTDASTDTISIKAAMIRPDENVFRVENYDVNGVLILLAENENGGITDQQFFHESEISSARVAFIPKEDLDALRENGSVVRLDQLVEDIVLGYLNETDSEAAKARLKEMGHDWVHGKVDGRLDEYVERLNTQQDEINARYLPIPGEDGPTVSAEHKLEMTLTSP